MQADVPCRICGDRVRAPSPLALELLGVDALPSWLADLCLSCLYSIDVPQDDEGNVLRPVTMDDLNELLTRRVAEYGRRVGAGLSIDRCEAIGGGHFVDDPDDMRCERFAGHDWEGRRVCGHCRRRLRHGTHAPPLINTGYRRAKPYLIWARDADELMERARELASPRSDYG